MYSHTEIWRAIDRLAAAFGYSASGLAKKAGLDPTTFNKSKRHSTDGKPRWPSTESIAKILDVTGMTMSEFFSLGSGEAPSENRRTVPLLNLAQAGRKGSFDKNGLPSGAGWGQVALPPAHPAGEPIYALEIGDSSMAPIYRQGDIVIVAPEAGIRNGDRVFIKTGRGDALIRELVKRAEDRIELRAVNQKQDISALELENIAWMARIIWVSQ